MNLLVLFLTIVFFLSSSCGLISLLYIYSSILVLGPQALCVIRIADFPIASFLTLHPRTFNASDYDQSQVTILK